jgi:hypothetical protein
MARGEALRLGPFVGGLNTASDPTAIADTELVECINWELDIDGSLISRPSITETVSGGQNNMTIIGCGTFPGGNYLIGSSANGVYAFNGISWTTITTTIRSYVALQYGGFVWIVPAPGSASPGGRWDPAGGWVTDVNMPQGESAVFHKSRMFIVPGISASTNSSRIRFTDPISSSTLTWTSTNLIDVNPGDGQNLIDLAVYNDNLMLFKDHSTYLLAYDLRPTDAILRTINSVIGVTTRYCVVSYENSIFVLHEGEVYEVINFDFTRINLKVPFVLDTTQPSIGNRVNDVFLTLLGDRLIVRFYSRIYVYGLKTRTWTRWASGNEHLHNFGPLMAFPATSGTSQQTDFYAGQITGTNKIVYLKDGYSATKAEGLTGTPVDIECFMQTKNYDLADSHHFKRLMWWGADVLTTRDIEATVTPISQSFQITWAQMALNTWGFYSDKTWARPLDSPATVTTPVANSSSAGRLFAKFLKSIRFRQANFSLTILTNGTTAQGPARLFSLTAIVGSKQTVAKQVN